MEKQHLKQFAYGFSALVLGLSTVGIFPASVHAEPVDESAVAGLEVPADTEPAADTELEVPAADGPVDTAPAADEPEVPVDEESDGEEPALGGSLRTAGVDDDDDEGDGESGIVRVGDAVMPHWEITRKAVNINESFTVEAIPGATVVAWNFTQSEDDEYMMMAVPADGDYGVAPFGFVEATEEEISVEETDEGEYTIMALKPGIYGVYLVDRVMFPTELTGFMLTAVGATSEAGATITDVYNANIEDEQAIWDARMECMSAVWSGEDAEGACWEEVAAFEEEQYTKIEQRTWNTFGEDTWAIEEAVATGKTLTTEVVVESLEEADVDEEIKDALLSELDITFSGDVKYYDVELLVKDEDGNVIGTLKELTGQQAVVIDGFTGAAAGYKRVFKVLAYHTRYDENGEAYTEVIEIDNVEFDEATGSIIFPADRFSTYLVAYKDVFAPSVNTGAATDTEGASATSSAAVSVLAVVTIVTLLGVTKFAKLRK